MGFGIGLGGAAKGLEAGRAMRQRDRQLALSELSQMQDVDLRERALGIKEAQLAQTQGQELTAQADKIIAGHMKVIGEVVKAGQAAGKSPDQIKAAVEPLLADIDALNSKLGRSTANIRTQVDTLAAAPTAVAQPKPPSGYRYTQEGNLEIIPGGPADKKGGGEKPIPAEVAGRIAMMDTALQDFQKAREALTSKWGVGGTVQSVIGAGEIGRAQRQVRSLIEAALRAMTGAAAPDAEVARYMDLYMPNAADTPETANQKLDLLTGFATNAKKLVMQGRGGSAVAEGPVPESTGPMPMPADKALLRPGQVYDLPNGRQGLWDGEAFEMLN